jgi:hypothetical protein
MEDQIEKKSNELKQLIRETPYDLLQERVYICVSNGCLLLTSFLQDQGKPGWSSKLVDSTGLPMLSSPDQKKIETILSSSPWLLDFLKDTNEEREIENQEGGGNPILQATRDTQLIQPVIPFANLTGEDVSLDKMFKDFLKKTDEMDVYWGKFAKESPGISKMLNRDVMIPTPSGVPLPVPLRPLVSFFTTLIDIIRLAGASLGFKNILFTLFVFIEELITGQWRQMLLTGLGFFSPAGVAIGVIGKFIVNAWMFVNPSLRNDILNSVYKGGKSVIVGFLLWCVSVLPPQMVKNQIENSLNLAKQTVEDLDSSIQKLEDEGNKVLLPVGKRMSIKGLNLDIVKNISLEDIQNLQSLAQWKTLICSKEFNSIMEPLKNIPIFRLIIELLGIPTLPEDKLQVCGPEPYRSIVDIVKDDLTPVITDTGSSPLDSIQSSITTSLPGVPKIEFPEIKKGGRRKNKKTRKHKNKLK